MFLDMLWHNTCDYYIWCGDVFITHKFGLPNFHFGYHLQDGQFESIWAYSRNLKQQNVFYVITANCIDNTSLGGRQIPFVCNDGCGASKAVTNGPSSGFSSLASSFTKSNGEGNAKGNRR